MRFFNFHREPEISRADRDYQILFRIIKELDRQGLNKLLKAVESLWEGYDALRRLKTIDEKETAKVDDIEKQIEQDMNSGEFLDDLEPIK